MLCFSIHRLKIIFAFLPVSLLPIIWIPLYFYKLLVIAIARIFKKEYSGRVYSPMDSLLEEDFSEANVSKNSLVCSMTLEGDMTVEELRYLFDKNVLEAAISDTSIMSRLWGKRGHYYVRYPELKQYPSFFMGYRFWKDDPNFKIEDHIVERVYTDIVGDFDSQPSLSMIHEQMLNKKFQEHKSPWEMVLIRNYKGGIEDNQNENVHRCLLISRMHHSMADAKSITQLFVECLGQKKLSTASAQARKPRNFCFYLLFPISFYLAILMIVIKSLRYRAHKFRVHSSRKNTEQIPQRVRFSSRLSMQEIKSVAKKHGTTTSSAILGIISGAIRRSNPDLGSSKLLSVYILPRPNHPDTLGNHLHLGVLILPTDVEKPGERVKQCQKIFSDLKASNIEKYLQFTLFQCGNLFNPVRKYILRDFTCPMAITNIAGESSGFSIGNSFCSESVFSVGTSLGCAGVVFCASSYKEYIRIAVIADEDVASELQTDELAKAMLDELETLKAL